MNEEKAIDSYQNLGPDQILNAIESTGLMCDGRIFALNSYENRVYQIGINESEPVIAKFYRPARWSDEAIREEQQFTIQLAEHEIPVIGPMVDENGETLHRYENFRFTLYPRRGGRPPELDNPEHLKQLGRFMARIHNVSAAESYQHRPTLDPETFGTDCNIYLLENGFIPMELVTAYRTLTEDIMKRIYQCYERAGDVSIIRLHGDCHHGNILWRDDSPFILDFDDARMGPAIQDLWMFLSGDREYMTERLADLLEGYSEFRDFNICELYLIEALRSLRIMHHSAWLARRWSDPAFPMAFPYFNTQHYWEDHILSLREQAALMDEPPLQWDRLY
jgi:Ser/Thr protein kinase RdoA (MazF antagonist)